MTTSAPVLVPNIKFPNGEPVAVCNTGCRLMLRQEIFVNAPREGRRTWIHPQGRCAFDGRPLPTTTPAD